MNEHRRIELTEFVNDNLAWDCDSELIDDIVDLIETKSAEYALHIAEQAVGEVKKSYSQINSPITDVALNKILSRIKQLTNDK